MLFGLSIYYHNCNSVFLTKKQNKKKTFKSDWIGTIV